VAIGTWGALGQISESVQSSPDGDEVLDAWNVNMLNLLHSANLILSPANFTLQTGSLGPFQIAASFDAVPPNPPGIFRGYLPYISAP
jgi:hypothetical protein